MRWKRSSLDSQRSAVLWRLRGGTTDLAPAQVLLVLLCCFLLPTPLLAQQEAGLLWQVQSDGRLSAIAVAGDGSRTALGGRDNLVRFVDQSGAELWRFAAENSILGLDITDDGAWVAVASEDRFVYLLDAATDAAARLQWQFKTGKPANHVALADDGSLVAATSDDLSLYALAGDGTLLWQEPLGIDVRAVAIYGTGDKARVVVGSDDGLLSIYSHDGRRLLQTQLDYAIEAVAVRPNGARILVGTRDGTVSLLNGSNGELLWRFKGTDTILSVALTRDGKLALAGAEDGTVYLLDEAGTVQQRFDQRESVLAVALNGDGRQLALGTIGGQGRFYDRDVALVDAQGRVQQRRLTVGLSTGLVLLLAAVGTWAVRTTTVGQQVWTTRTARPRTLLQEIWRARFSYLLILPTLLLLLTFNYYPAFSGLYHAFTDWSPGIKSEWVGFANFHLLLENRFFLSGFRNAGILIVVSIVRTLTVPLLVAELIFNLRNRFAQYWTRTLFIVPIVLPLVVEILLWNNIYDPTIGLLNKTLEAVGLGAWARVWYGDANVALASIIFIGFPWVNAFALLIFYGGLINISDEVIDASKVDGASTWRRFWRIDLPLVMGQIKLLLILNFINAVQTFELVFLTTGGGPGAATYTPALELYYSAMRMNRFGVASAIGMVLFVIIMIGTIINMRFVQSATEYEA
ncbi:MAG TPA: ABC transporter permease subunit [Caldilineaceae bacterium]|nr:ABC transporter permease subunit [Caldilineaceae bacterium]